ncbi:MAG: right-handed parallel beta-helix repeat-containing protein [Chloroflexota bacterium]|nr:right-handed parallel beta-helix repeat-containing protein [Chloroflexota bacterium]
MRVNRFRRICCALALALAAFLTVVANASDNASSDGGYTVSEPVVISAVGYPADEPYVIENLEITNVGRANDCGNGILVESAANVVIRNCYIHDTDDAAIEVVSSENITIEDCTIVRATLTEEGNFWGGIVALDSTNVVIEGNSVGSTVSGAAIVAEDGCVNVSIVDNMLEDNGSQKKERDAEGYAVEGGYPEFGVSIGISVGGGSQDVVVSGNSVANSTSDGIAVKDGARNVEVFGNVLTASDEQGIWLVAVGENISIHDNRILDTVEYGLFLEWGVENVDIYNNDIERSMYAGFSIVNSRNSNIHDNAVVQTRGPAFELGYQSQADTEYISGLSLGFRTAGNHIWGNRITSGIAFEQAGGGDAVAGYDMWAENDIFDNTINGEPQGDSGETGDACWPLYVGIAGGVAALAAVAAVVLKFGSNRKHAYRRKVSSK